MYTFEDAGGRSLTLRPEGTAPVVPRLPRARHAQAAAAGEALVPVAASSARRSRRPGASASSGRSGAEAIGSDDPAVDAESIAPAAHAARRARRPRPAAAPRLASGRLDARAEYRERLHGLPARATPSACSADVRDRIDLNPLRAFDADHPGTQEVMRDAPLLLDSLERRGPRALRRGPRAARRRRASPTRSTRRSCAASTTTRARSSSSPPTRSARSPASAAAGATTGSSSCSAARRRPAWAGPPGIERMLLAAERAARAGAGRRPLRRATSDRGASRPSRWPPRRARAGLAVQQELAGRSLKGQLKQADRAGARYVAILGADGIAAAATWTPASRRTVDVRGGRGRAASSRDAICDEARSDAPTPTATPGPAT